MRFSEAIAADPVQVKRKLEGPPAPAPELFPATEYAGLETTTRSRPETTSDATAKTASETTAAHASHAEGRDARVFQ